MYALNELKIFVCKFHRALFLFPTSFFYIVSICVPFFHSGMLPVLQLAGLILALSIPGITTLSATLRFLGQTDFVVNESSTAVVRLVVERVGDPVNVTALVLVGQWAISSSVTDCVCTHQPANHIFYCIYKQKEIHNTGIILALIHHVMQRRTVTLLRCKAITCAVCPVITLSMANSGGDIKDPMCLQKLSWKSQNERWFYVLHMGPSVSCSQLVSGKPSWPCMLHSMAGEFPMLLDIFTILLVSTIIPGLRLMKNCVILGSFQETNGHRQKLMEFQDHKDKGTSIK